MVAAHWEDSAVVMSGCGHRGRSSMSSLGLRADSPREEPPDSPGAKFSCMRFAKHRTDCRTGPNRLKTQRSPLLLSQTSQACIRITPQSTVRDWCCRNECCRAALTWTGPDRAVLVLPMCVAAEQDNRNPTVSQDSPSAAQGAGLATSSHARAAYWSET